MLLHGLAIDVQLSSCGSTAQITKHNAEFFYAASYYLCCTHSCACHRQVRMGFGLHVGWAIEGAIGSDYKIDASYLSPNVNMASRLEAATKQFGVTMLLSDDFVSLLSPGVRRRVRQVCC